MSDETKHLDLGLPSNINLKITLICNNLLQGEIHLNACISGVL